jgi:ppGpp synthetase/RelA/SpoT-type nucleotidyltranferase
MADRRVELTHTKGAINRAGETLRAHAVDGLEAAGGLGKVDEAFTVLADFRAAHAYPLTKCNMGLRSMLNTQNLPVRVSQRLKQERTVVDKLVRFPKTNLARMADIAGVRAVVDDVEEVRRLRDRIVQFRPPTIEHDYITEPKADGYRAHHLVVVYDDRQIEVQLRTLVQNEWAITLEDFGSRIGHNLKAGRGPSVVLEFFQAVSDAMALEESGGRADETQRARIATLKAQVLEHLPP